MTKKNLIDPKNLTATQAAALMGVTPQAIGLWYSKQGCPRNDNKRYDASELVSWKIAFEVERAKGGPSGADIDASRARKMAAEAEMKEIELKRRRGELVPRDQMVTNEINFATMVRRAIEMVPRRLDVTDSVRKQISDEINNTLVSVSQLGVSLNGRENDEEQD